MDMLPEFQDHPITSTTTNQLANVSVVVPNHINDTSTRMNSATIAPLTSTTLPSTAPLKKHVCGSLFAKCNCANGGHHGIQLFQHNTTVAAGTHNTWRQTGIVCASRAVVAAQSDKVTSHTDQVGKGELVTAATIARDDNVVVLSRRCATTAGDGGNSGYLTAKKTGGGGKRYSDPEIKTVASVLAVARTSSICLQHPDIPYPILPEELLAVKSSVSGGVTVGGATRKKSSYGERQVPRYSKHTSIDLDPAPLLSQQHKNLLEHYKCTALAYEQQSQYQQSEHSFDDANQFLRDFGIFGSGARTAMGNGVGTTANTANVNSHKAAKKSIEHGNHSHLYHHQNQQNGNNYHQHQSTTEATRRRNSFADNEQMRNVVARLEKEFGELESRYGELQGELFACNKEVQCKEQEIFRLHREIHKLKSVLQQKTNRSKDEDILSSLQELHCMANRVPIIQGAILGNNASKKQGVSAESSDSMGQNDIKISKHDKDFRSKQLIKDAIMDNDFLKNLDSLQVREIVDAMYSKEFIAGSYVLREGEAGSHLYVSAEGELEVIKDGKVLGSMGSGKAFGELAILYNCTRTASIRVVLDSKIWVLDRKVFQQIMVRTGLQRLQENVNFLRSVPLLQNLNNDVLAKIADVLEIEFYPSGAYIIRQGATGDTFFILSSGSVRITQKVPNSLDEDEIRILRRGDYFGEQALLKEDYRTASVIALHPGVECLTLDRDSFIQLIGELNELKEKDYGDEQRTLARPTSSNSVSMMDTEFDYINLDDLEVVATLGIGGFGRVELVQYARDPTLTFALKCLKKQHIVDTQQQDHVFSEKLIMMGCKSKFICRLHRTFRDAKYVYMLLEACLGGEVWTVLRDRGSFDDHTTTFITACVLEAFQYLHSRGIIYRDLKPENLLMDARGYVKLVDFGFAKRLHQSTVRYGGGADGGLLGVGHTTGGGGSNKTWTFCGTPEYVAPETILNKGHDRAVDYWALGVLMHELLSGNPPFTASDPMTTYNLILKGIDMIDFGRFNISRAAQSLIKKLCRDSPSERLGYQRGGIQDIKKHKWFQGFDWDGLNNGTLQAPIVKGVRGPCDTTNFDCYSKDNDIPPNELSNWDADF